MRRRTQILLVVLVVIIGSIGVIRAWTFWEWVEENGRPYFVPVIVTPSLQLVNGEVVLYKMTNVSTEAVSVRLNLYNDSDKIPGTFKDFRRVPGSTTVSYVFEPPKTKLTLGATTVDAPEPVRAQFTPVPGDDPGAMRRIVASVQVLRIQTGTPDGTPSLEQSMVVPLERCNFEPRGYVPVATGHKRVWNCAPQMYPYDMKWLSPWRGPVGPAPTNLNWPE